MVPPLHAIRNAVLHDYQVSKGGVDSVEMIIADAVRPGARTVLLTIEPKLTLRYFYFAAYNAWRVMGLLTFYEKEILTIADPDARRAALDALTVDQMRSGANKYTRRFPSFVNALGKDMLGSRIPLGSFFSGATEAAPAATAATPAAPGAPGFRPLAAHPDEMLLFVKARAREESRAVGLVDFFPHTSLVLSDGAFSSSTPGHVVLSSPYLEARIAQLLNAFETRPAPKAYRPTRVAFWENTGRTLRLAIILAHPRVTLSSGETPKRATCSWCGVMRKLKVRLACALCGEEFCDVECFVAFHTILDFPTPDETGSASEGAAEGGPGAGGAGTGTGAMGGVGSGGAGSGAAAAAAAVGPVPLDLGATSEDGDEESEDDESGDDDSGDDASDDDDASSPRDRRRGVPAPARGRAGATSSRGGRPRGRGAVKRARRRS